MNVGIGSASRSDALSFWPEFLVNLLAKPVLYNVRRTYLSGTRGCFAGSGIGNDHSGASIASPGHPTFCSWCFANTERGVKLETKRQVLRRFRFFALRSCEVPTLFGVVALQARATVDSSVLAYRALDTCTTGPLSQLLILLMS